MQDRQYGSKFQIAQLPQKEDTSYACNTKKNRNSGSAWNVYITPNILVAALYPWCIQTPTDGIKPQNVPYFKQYQDLEMKVALEQYTQTYIPKISKHSVKLITSSRFRPMKMARVEEAKGSPCPICPYAFPANDAAIPRTANVVANPNEKAIEFPIT